MIVQPYLISGMWRDMRLNPRWSVAQKRSGEHTLLQVWLLSIIEQCTLRIDCEVDEEWTTGLSFTTHLYSSQVFNKNVWELDGGCALKCGLYKTTQTTLVHASSPWYETAHAQGCLCFNKKKAKLRLLKFDIHEKKADWLAVPLDGTPGCLYLQHSASHGI